ncbi:LacI family transcriptional regulator [Kaistella flava (ex Peng et al. 2021)]|uniref:LacI family transcriptional regulator n=1 Tax=Kaistella flava (ex Peng et al. 2021) TaxID=2038776 RepID=A0A7M2YA29_9FLAO|nr:LacI family DNA-binding transcriptional regulator [Kaistella flava (ex Peng et al. 2021)]QOW10434.1 LacI family transcriptional regulator [Kaistella flava (ex Peng et al. 2021)]
MIKKVTIYDIAKVLNVTAATVSRALNNNKNISEATKKLVLETAEKMNYEPNKLALALKSGKSNNIGVIVPRINTNFFGSIIRGIEDELNPSGYHIIICQSHNDETKEINNIESLINSQVDAIFISTSSKHSEQFEKILKKNIPLIFFDRKKTMDGVSSVTIDDFAGGYMATKHLIDQGCRKIAHLASGDFKIEIFHDRHEGYKQALIDHGIDYREDYVIHTTSKIAEGKIAVAQLFELDEKPDAIFSSSDFLALGAIQELKARNIKIPEEVAVIGFANEPFTNFEELSISTIDQFPVEMGQMTARVFLEQMATSQNIKIDKKVVMEPKLIIRKSSKK